MRRPADFEAVLRSGFSQASRNFVVRAYPNAGAHARLGIIAGKKAAARAVDRNRAKRLIREAFHAVCAGLGAYDVTVQLRTDLKNEVNPALREELRGALESLMRRAAKARRPQPHRQ